MRRLAWSDVTPKPLWLNRRQLMAGATALVATPALAELKATPSPYSTDAQPNSLEDITGYNNFYEFGTGKEDPAAYAGRADRRPLVDRDRRDGRQARYL
jgi:sulfoxide reductase catalytic subunit YedY